MNELTHIDFQRRHAGFVFAPFVTGRRNAAYRIDADVIYTPEGLRLRDPGDNPRRRRAQQHFAAEYAKYSALVQDGQAMPGGWYAPAEHSQERAATEDEYTSLVRKTVDFIRAAGIAKVVVSRTTRQSLPEGFDAVNSLPGAGGPLPHGVCFAGRHSGDRHVAGRVARGPAHARRRGADHHGPGRHAAPPGRPPAFRRRSGATRKPSSRKW